MNPKSSWQAAQARAGARPAGFSCR
jgi:hypothetical protein